MKDSSPKIEEVVWVPGTRPELDEMVRQSPCELRQERKQLWAAYLPSGSPKLVLCMRYLERDDSFPRLADYIREVGPNQLFDYLYAVDTYRQSRILGRSLPGATESSYRPDAFIDEVLSSSRGLLLWQFHLEQLAQALGLSRREAIELARRVNQKRPSALDPVGAKTFPSGQTLVDVVENRLVYDGVLPGQWQAARLLLQARNQ